MSLLDSVGQAVMLIMRGDAEVWRVTAVSLEVSLIALALAILVGLPIGYAFAIARRRIASVASWAPPRFSSTLPGLRHDAVDGVLETRATPAPARPDRKTRGR